MPFVSIGLTDGIPHGVLPQNQTLVRGGFTFNVTLVVRNVNLSTSTVQASSKLIEVDVACPSCQTDFKPIYLTGQVSPANLQSAAIRRRSGRAGLRRFRPAGQGSHGHGPEHGHFVGDRYRRDQRQRHPPDHRRAAGRAMSIASQSARPAIRRRGRIRRAAAAIPIRRSPDATVLQGQVSQVSLAIDRLSTLQFQQRQFRLRAARQSPLQSDRLQDRSAPTCRNIPQNLATGAGGTLSLPTMEWDTYTFTPNDSDIRCFRHHAIQPVHLESRTARRLSKSRSCPRIRTACWWPWPTAPPHLPISGATVQVDRRRADTTRRKSPARAISTRRTGRAVPAKPHICAE